MDNSDDATIKGFGDEWERFDQNCLEQEELNSLFNKYFDIFPKQFLNKKNVGFDMGCGSGRWAKLIAPKVKKLHCIDPSPAINIAKNNLKSFKNCEFHNKGVSNINFSEESMDFGFSLGVLHHVPDTEAAIKSCVRLLKKNSPFLIYLYYSFDNKPFFYKVVWKITEILRFIISRLSYPLRYFCSQIIAFFIYIPLSRIALICEKIGFRKKFVENIPLSFYRSLSIYTIKTDALDRFGTRLEKRFSKREIYYMMKRSGLEKIRFSNDSPYWIAVGIKT